MLESLYLGALFNLKEIYHCHFPERPFSHAQLACFGNLRSIDLYRCIHLTNVLSLSIARGLVQLQQLHTRWCDDREAIFSMEEEYEKTLDDIKFP